MLYKHLRPSFNNYRYAHSNFLKGKNVKQESFNAHFVEVNHNGEDNWEVRLIDLTDNVEKVRKRIFLVTWAGYFSAYCIE